MAILRIPLPPAVNVTGSSTQRTKLSGREYLLRLQWNQRAGRWTLDISDQDGVLIVAGLALVVGWPLLTLVTDDRRPPGEIAILDTQQKGEDPTLTSLGSRHTLWYWEPTT